MEMVAAATGSTDAGGDEVVTPTYSSDLDVGELRSYSDRFRR